MANEININEIAEALARVQFDYSNMAISWYNIFYNPIPMDVQIEFYDHEGRAHTYVIPNRAKDKSYITNGEFANPNENVAAAVGTIYQCTTTGDLYVKIFGEGSTGWIKVVSQSDMDAIIVRKNGNPNETGEVRDFGTLYVDLSTGYMYMRRADSVEAYKWDRVDSYATALLTETFVVTEETTEFVLNGICQNELVLSVYENGVLINPKTYSMPYGDNRTVVLENPVVVPETEESVEVTIRYFIDCHVAESTAQNDCLNYVIQAKQYAMGDYVAEQGEDQSCKWYYLQMKDIKLNLESQIAGIEDKYKECQDALDYYYRQYHDEFVKIQTETVKYIDDNAAQFTAGVTKVYNYSVQVAKQTSECNKLYENIKVAEKNTVSYADYVRDTVTDLATKTELKEADDRLSDSIRTTRNGLTDYVDNNVTVLNDSIADAKNEVLLELESRAENLKAEYDNLYDYTTNQINTVNSWIEAHGDLADFQNASGFINKENFPIDVNGIYKYEKVLEKKTDIVVEVDKDCTYYSINVGEMMADVGSDLDFTLTIKPGTKINTNMETDLVNYDHVVSHIRVYLKNETNYTPYVFWDENRISWLGDEPELEAGEDYIIEFISDDMMSSWKAHVLGICQPAIQVDTFSTYFNIACPSITDDPTLITQPVSVVMNLDGYDMYLDGDFYFNTTTNMLVIPQEIARKYKGSEVSNIGIRVPGSPKFTRYYSVTTYTLAEDEVFRVNCYNEVTAQHTFNFTVKSDEINAYMRDNELTSAEVSLKVKMDWGLASTTVISGTYYFDPDDDDSTGAVFVFENDVIPDDEAAEQPNHVRVIKMKADFMTGSNCVMSDSVNEEGTNTILITPDANGTLYANNSVAAWDDDDMWYVSVTES